MWASFDINNQPEIANAMLTVNSQETPIMQWDYGTKINGAIADTSNSNVNVRSQPTTSAAVVSWSPLKHGSSVNYWENASPDTANGYHWFKVERNGVIGFVAAEYVDFTAPPTGEYLTYAKADIDAIYALLAKGQPSSGGGTF